MPVFPTSRYFGLIWLSTSKCSGNRPTLCLLKIILPSTSTVKDPTRAGYEFRLNARLFLDRFRQTGGCGEIVSLSATGDAYVS